MDAPLPPDRETDLRRRFDDQRRAFVQLARDRSNAISGERLLEQTRQTEALHRLRARWLASDDPRDQGE
jgi:hypothetical protein